MFYEYHPSATIIVSCHRSTNTAPLNHHLFIVVYYEFVSPQLLIFIVIDYDIFCEFSEPATTIWELPDADYEGTGMNSRAHHSECVCVYACMHVYLRVLHTPPRLLSSLH